MIWQHITAAYSRDLSEKTAVRVSSTIAARTSGRIYVPG